MYFFTICSNNYLAQARVLGRSVLHHHPDSRFTVFLMDEPSERVNYAELEFEVIPVSDIEPDIANLALKYDIIELNTSIKPKVIEYLFTMRDQSKVVYLDPDTRAYRYFEEVDKGLDEFNIMLTPHIFTPIPHDGKTPQESLFLNYGIYNLGFIAIKRSEESMRFIRWWKDWTYEKGYNKVSDGIFVDQLPINHVPLFFKQVHIIGSRGYNMAPWNLHERILSDAGGSEKALVNNKDLLTFYHFSSFRLGSGELPVHSYTRYKMADRPDLKAIHLQYDKEMAQCGQQVLKSIPCVYVEQRKEHLRRKRNGILAAKPIHKRMLLAIFRLPVVRKITSNVMINNRSFDSYYEG